MACIEKEAIGICGTAQTASKARNCAVHLLKASVQNFINIKTQCLKGSGYIIGIVHGIAKTGKSGITAITDYQGKFISRGIILCKNPVNGKSRQKR